NGTIWMMALTLALAQWYRVPVHPFHSGILVGLVLYNAVWSGMLSLIFTTEFMYRWRFVNSAAFILLGMWFAWLAWRPEPEAAVAQEDVLRRLRASPENTLRTPRLKAG